MNRVKVFASLAGLLVMLTVAAPSAHAATISYVATDLADVVGGEDLWRYDYIVSGIVFDADQGFSVGFDRTLFKDLESPPAAVNADWDALTLQPDLAIPEDGLYDALALVNGASLADLFSVSFVWLGAPGTAPGTQPFTINQFDLAGGLTVISAGRTTPLAAVPEPATLLLLASGAASLVRRARRGAHGA